MRVLAAWILAVGLVATPSLAASRTGDNAPAAKSTADKDAAAKAKSSNTESAARNAKADAAKASAPAKADPAAVEGELQQLRDLLEAQSKQLQEQNEQLKEQQQKMESLEKQLSGSTASETAKGTATPATMSAMPVSATTADVNSNAAIRMPAASESSSRTATAAISSAANHEPNQASNDEPTSWRFKGVSFTPIGFFAAETVWRQRALSADVNTPFNSVPLPGSSQYNVSEFNASGRQSRIGMLVQGKLSNVKIGGYYEADFLSAGTTSNDNESNSYTLRQRQFWAQAAFDSGLTITGGQMWSLVTQTSKGVDNRTENLPETIDAQYHIGFSWARQYGVRFAKDWDNKVWLALAVEEPQATFKAHGTATPFLLGTAGNGGGLYNTAQSSYSFNMTPDFVVKAAFEPGFGHYEVFGVVSTFRDRIFPTGAAPFNDNRVGGGFGGNAWLPFDRGHINLGVHAMLGDGIGRYGTSGLPDATVRPDGTLALVRSYQGLGTLAFHYTKWDVYFNVGSEYAGRTQYISGTPTVLIPNEGYGAVGLDNSGCWTEAAPGSGGFSPAGLSACTGDTRNTIEGTAGLWYSIYTGPKGTMKFGLQYSHEALNTWSGVGKTGVCASTAHPDCGPNTNNNMVFTSFRYYIP